MSPAKSKNKKRDLIKTLERYFSVASFDEMEKIWNGIYDNKKGYKERKEAYNLSKPILRRLKPIFKEIIYEHNRIAQKNGFPTWIEHVMKLKGIDRKQITYFVGNVDKVIHQLYSKVPRVNDVPSWWWTKYALPHCHSHVTTPEYQMPEEIITLVKKMDPSTEKYFTKIEIEDDSFVEFPFCQYIPETKSCVIKMNLKATCFYERLTLVHELAHAFDFLSDVEQGKDPMIKSHYKHELFAHRFVHKFIDRHLEGNVKDAVNGKTLEDLVVAIFEYEIYKNPDDDFDVLYAKAHNRVFPISKQAKSDLYLVRDTVIMRPGLMIEHGVIDVELVMKKYD